MKKELPKRKNIRLKEYDYSRPGAYFITVCTKDRRCLLSRIVGTGLPDGPKTELTDYGKIADKYINQMSEFYEHISVEKYVIMPNHIHFILLVSENGPSKRSDVAGPYGAKFGGVEVCFYVQAVLQ